MPPIKPEVCVIGDRLAVFMGADYKMQELDEAERFLRKYQGTVAKLRRQHKRAARQLKQVRT